MLNKMNIFAWRFSKSCQPNESQRVHGTAYQPVFLPYIYVGWDMYLLLPYKIQAPTIKARWIFQYCINPKHRKNIVEHPIVVVYTVLFPLWYLDRYCFHYMACYLVVILLSIPMVLVVHEKDIYNVYWDIA